MEDNYILPTGLLSLFTGCYLPPLILSTVAQITLFSKFGLFEQNRRLSISSIVLTITLSPIIGFYALQLLVPN